MSCSPWTYAAGCLALTVAWISSPSSVGVAQEAATDAVDEIYLEEPPAIPPPVEVRAAALKDEFADGGIRVEREVLLLSDDQVINHGRYAEYYPGGQGQKFSEGTYDHGVHTGPWSFWHPNGQLCKTVTFKNGRADGTWDVFRPDGTLLAKKSYKENEHDGVWLQYHADGKTLKIEETFVDGLRNGVSTAYFANGKPQRAAEFKDGLLDGHMTEWDESGRKLGEMDFKAGKLDGHFVLYRADGTTIEQDYSEGRLLPPNKGN
jgi:antitoxin component YwqK of YwqJK toxin-antitoxin module